MAHIYYASPLGLICQYPVVLDSGIKTREWSYIRVRPMISLLEVPAPAATVMVSLGVLVYAGPIWALTYVILALGSYIYVNS